MYANMFRRLLAIACLYTVPWLPVAGIVYLIVRWT